MTETGIGLAMSWPAMSLSCHIVAPEASGNQAGPASPILPFSGHILLAITADERGRGGLESLRPQGVDCSVFTDGFTILA